jgi:hypothetical protein
MAQVSIRLRDGDMFLFPALDDGPEISAAAFAMKPRSTGRVRLNDRDPRTPLAIEHGFLTDASDVDLVAEGVDALRELAASPQLRRYVRRETRPGPEVSSLAHARTAFRGFFHPVGTCALGIVADTDGRVRDLDGVYVADASFVPELPRANTNLTVAAVAERIADSLASLITTRVSVTAWRRLVEAAHTSRARGRLFKSQCGPFITAATDRERKPLETAIAELEQTDGLRPPLGSLVLRSEPATG